MFIFGVYLDYSSVAVVVVLALCLTLVNWQGRIRSYKEMLSFYSQHSLESIDRLLESLEENADVALRGLKAYESRVLHVWSNLLRQARYYDRNAVVDTVEHLEQTLEQYFDALYRQDGGLETESVRELHCLRDRFMSLAHSASMPLPLRQKMKSGVDLMFHWTSTTRYLMNRLHKTKKKII